ncbi:1-acyl-sn-glycerol-3-phosphate acyltransferase [Luteolibacter flavescens]|uniref:1-acyl-sn-glycerol-3-phosphate acyltransferase n=1 Tax=Luteolibacter flavescens TaxID=1859460 RepID=A0ABT3FP83_9BACT|nr:1-acyl-sn-glycerol-3-phosphate acyltransferase [Luteolibacter flavescens]MCW1885388.1 1-acyl-sn-glycerol-3-phosphate acyltransferase [Luteolibacter flavescens]
MPKKEPFDITEVLPALAGDGWRGMARRSLERLLGLDQVRVSFRRAAEGDAGAFTEPLRAFGLAVDAPGFAEAVPDAGPVMVVANHPYGGADALALGSLCETRRPDMLLLANRMTADIPSLGDRTIPLSILNEGAAARDNARSLRAALQHLRSGGLIACFPSGEVASLREGRVAEGPWSPHMAALALKTRATVVVVGFEGEAPPWFHQAGKLHPMVRTALLPRVLLSMRGQTVVCRTSRIGPEEMASLSPDELAAMLRERAVGQPGL